MVIPLHYIYCRELAIVRSALALRELAPTTNKRTAAAPTRRDHDFTFFSSREPNNAPMARAASSSPNLLPHGLFTTRQRLQFGLHNAASTHSTSVRFSMGRHEDRPGALSQATMDLVTILPAFDDLGFSQALGPRRYTIGTMRR